MKFSAWHWSSGIWDRDVCTLGSPRSPRCIPYAPGHVPRPHLAYTSGQAPGGIWGCDPSSVMFGILPPWPLSRTCFQQGPFLLLELSQLVSPSSALLMSGDFVFFPRAAMGCPGNRLALFLCSMTPSLKVNVLQASLQESFGAHLPKSTTFQKQDYLLYPSALSPHIHWAMWVPWAPRSNLPRLKGCLRVHWGAESTSTSDCGHGHDRTVWLPGKSRL